MAGHSADAYAGWMDSDGNQARAGIIDTPDPHIRSVAIEVDAPADRVFDIVARPAMHPVIDGSGTVRGRLRGPERLELGARFGMRMRIGLPYVIWNEVVEFDEGHRIAWRHVNRHTWRYEFLPIDPGRTRVIETFDGTTARFPPGLRLMNAYEANERAMAKTLVNLKAIAEQAAKG